MIYNILIDSASKPLFINKDIFIFYCFKLVPSCLLNKNLLILKRTYFAGNRLPGLEGIFC